MNISSCFESGCKNYTQTVQENICCKCLEYYCNPCITKTQEISYCSSHAKIYGVIKSSEQRENDELEPIMILIKDRNVKALNELSSIRARTIINKLKNDIEDLEFFFLWFSEWSGGLLPGTGSYHYEDIKDNETFDIYKKYQFGPCNLFDDTITEEQWSYILSIGYITQEQYEERSA